MESIFISNIKIKNTKIIKNLEIPLSERKRKHLILTGKNGSGKTSLLLALHKYLNGLNNGLVERQEKTSQMYPDYDHYKANNYFIKELGDVKIIFKNSHLLWEKIEKGTFIIAYFEAKRHITLKIPSGINKINLNPKYLLQSQANQDFIQYIVNLKADRSFARDDGENNIVLKIDQWFDKFQNKLKEIFDSPSLELKFDRKNYTFHIIEENKEPYGFNTLSDGYSSIISIVTELILRMEAHKVKSYDMEGLVLIDEIETHLHVDLQKKILPFLISFFPKIQFIISTHSPFVLSSVENAIICDLESNIITSDLSGYSYDALIESYFYSDKYSDLVKDKITEYEILSLKDNLNIEEQVNLKELEKYFSHIPKYLSDELFVKLQQITLNKLNVKG